MARARLRAGRPPGWASRSTPTPTTSSTSAAARTATRRCAPRTWSTTKRDALHAAAAARRRDPRGLRRLSAARAPPTSSATSELPGVGLVDLRTVREDGPAADRQRRDRGRACPGWTARGCSRASRTTAGRTHLGAGEQPLGRVLRGHGNTGDSGHEGVRRGNVIGTYLHGPLLPKNAWFADWLLATALGLPRSRAARRRLRGRRAQLRQARRRRVASPRAPARRRSAP